MKTIAMKLNVKILIAGLVIIIGTNVVALVGVAYNRSGEPDAVVELTERELSMPYRYRMNKENTGLGLRINCRLEMDAQVYGYGYTNCLGNPAWLNQEKLTELGFSFKSRKEKEEGYFSYEKALPRTVYLVLEYNGAAYQSALASKEKELSEEKALLANNPGKAEFAKRVKSAQDKLNGERNSNSRLFAIDVGQDKTALRSTYPDKSRYILMQASIKPVWNSNKNKDEWIGMISSLLINTINIPLEHRDVLEPMENIETRLDRIKQTPRYKVRVAFGKRVEPWVIGVEKL